MTEQTDAAEVEALARELCKADGKVYWIEAFPAIYRYQARAVLASDWFAAREAAAEARGAQAVLAVVEEIHAPFTTPDGVTLCSGCPDPWPCDSRTKAAAAACRDGRGWAKDPEAALAALARWEREQS